MTIRTARLRLEPAAHSDLLAVGLGEDVLAQTLGVSIAPQWAGADALDADLGGRKYPAYGPRPLPGSHAVRQGVP